MKDSQNDLTHHGITSGVVVVCTTAKAIKLSKKYEDLYRRNYSSTTTLPVCHGCNIQT